jgi:5-methylcytosine-specific restriction enzyme A
MGYAEPGSSRCKACGGGKWCRKDRRRGNPYGAEWRRIRDKILERDRHVCKKCGARASNVDHILAKADGGSDDLSNLRSLCLRCHKAWTAEQNRVRRTRA